MWPGDPAPCGYHASDLRLLRRGVQAVARIAEMIGELELKPGRMGLIVNQRPGRRFWTTEFAGRSNGTV